MQSRFKQAIWWSFSLAVVAGITILYFAFNQEPKPPLHLPTVEGAVIMASDNPHRQAPLSGVEITASAHGYTTGTRSEASGRFRLPMAREWKRGDPITLLFRSLNFKPVEQALPPTPDLLIVRMEPVDRPAVANGAPTKVPSIAITNTRIRYSTEFLSTNNIGSIAPTMDVRNKGNQPCKGDGACSPDGVWKATVVSKTLDAGPDNQYVNTRVSCIAGPCPFTRVEDDSYTRPARVITIRVRNWSDTATFLIEAEVSRTQRSNFVREAYPAIFGQAMTFTMPATAQGLSISAELNGNLIIFPIGPAHQLSWASCSVENPPDGSQLFRCELKLGYFFQ